ncbi:MAG: hypothetical protein HY094_09400 [Candidatus Melainabacteria bacterium]|nr:hypothetical protein [Candidatus Melainabacteria bacterium]
MKRYLFLILVFLSSIIFFLRAQGQTDFLNQTSSSSGSLATSSSSSGSQCDIELSKTITNVSYPNGCTVEGKNITCCPLSQLGVGFITYGDSLGDDLNDLIVSWTVDCSSKKVTFTGSGESACLATATTLCGEVNNMDSSPKICNLPSSSVCCPGILPTPLPTPEEPEIIKSLNRIIETEGKAVDKLRDGKIDKTFDNLNPALRDLKSFRVDLFPTDSLVHNARDEVKIRMKNNLSCAIKHDDKASKILRSALKDGGSSKLELNAYDELKKAQNCKQKLLEDLEFLEKHKKK